MLKNISKNGIIDRLANSIWYKSGVRNIYEINWGKHEIFVDNKRFKIDDFDCVVIYSSNNYGHINIEGKGIVINMIFSGDYYKMRRIAMEIIHRYRLKIRTENNYDQSGCV